MATTKKYLRLAVYAPALGRDDGRPLAIVHGMESAVPGLRLEWTNSDTNELIALPQRDEWVASSKTDRGLPFLCNDDESHPVTVAGWESPGRLAPGSRPRFEVHADWPLDEAGIAAAVDVLVTTGDSARAFWGYVDPEGVAGTVAQQFRHPGDESPAPPHGLPSLKLPEELRSDEIPHFLGWLNYWSAAAAQAIGFPDPPRDAELLSRARRTASGGWVVQLTDAPLDLDNPAHLDTLKRTYERFPEIGGRAAP
uniref:DUF5953 family protein n=1 Tax=Corallococcus coralloides TaxID=184914 RepID=UPI000FFEB88F|nr:DUF5953 family protein [Corallococcus coralloides]